MKKVATLEQLMEVAFSQEAGLVKLELGEVTQAQAAAIKKTAGVDLEGYMHVVDTYAIRHAIAQHGSPRQEAQRGQVAVGVDDFARIPEVVASPDAVRFHGVNKQGNPALVYEKTLGGKTFYVAEVRVGRKELAMQTMYKRKASTKK